MKLEKTTNNTAYSPMDYLTTKQIEEALDKAINNYNHNFYYKADSILLKPMYLNLILDSEKYQYMCSKHTYRGLEIYRTENIDQPFELHNLRHSE